jgi:hypothetical protein
MKNTTRQAVANLAMAWTPSSTIQTITVTYWGDTPFYVSVLNQVEGSHRHFWSALHKGIADKVAQQMLKTDEYSGFTLKKEVR